MNLNTDFIQQEKFASTLLSNLSKYGFGVLSKTDFEALTLHALIESSSELADADSYRRAELLRITDQKYRNLSRRIGMWLQPQVENDVNTYNRFLEQSIALYAESPDANDIRIVIDDEMERRNIQRSIERISSKSGASIGADISLNGRQLVLRGSDLDLLITRANKAGVLAEGVNTILNERKGVERRKAFLELAKKGVIEITKLIAQVAIS